MSGNKRWMGKQGGQAWRWEVKELKSETQSQSGYWLPNMAT